jgi:hypothetical protein
MNKIVAGVMMGIAMCALMLAFLPSARTTVELGEYVDLGAYVRRPRYTDAMGDGIVIQDSSGSTDCMLVVPARPGEMCVHVCGGYYVRAFRARWGRR